MSENRPPKSAHSEQLMEDNLSHGRWPLLWKTTSPMEDNLSMEDDLSYVEDDLFYGRRPLLWKMTSHMEVNLSYGRSRGHSPWELLTLNSGIFLYSPYCQMFLVTWFFWLGEGRIKKGVGLDPRIHYFGVYGILAAKQVIWNQNIVKFVKNRKFTQGKIYPGYNTGW